MSKCFCKESTCKKDCTKNHTCQEHYCNKCEPESKSEAFENNCKVIEKTGDNIPVGRCWHNMKDGKCPRHGMSIFDQIKVGFGMGYSAVIKSEYGEGVIIDIGNGGYQYIVRYKEIIDKVRIDNEHNFEITGWKYGAELCGNEPIPEGQKFRVKNNLQPSIKEFCKEQGDRACLTEGYIGKTWHDKSEIEPYFE